MITALAGDQDLSIITDRKNLSHLKLLRKKNIRKSLISFPGLGGESALMINQLIS